MEIAMPVIERQFSGQRVREAREHLGLSRQSVAVALRVTYHTVMNWEEGFTAPHINRMTELAQFLECDVFDFFVEVNGD